MATDAEPPEEMNIKEAARFVVASGTCEERRHCSGRHGWCAIRRALRLVRHLRHLCATREGLGGAPITRRAARSWKPLRHLRHLPSNRALRDNIVISSTYHPERV